MVHFSNGRRQPSLPYINLLRAQTQQEASALAALLAITTRQICDVGVRGQSLRDLTAGIDTTNLNQTVAGLGDSLANDFGGLGFTLGADNVGLSLLLGALDDESCSFGVLLGDLLLLDGLGELLAEGHVGDGDVLQSDVELRSALEKVGADAVGHGFTLRDELGGVELGHDGFEDFVSDGGENTLVIIGTI